MIAPMDHFGHHLQMKIISIFFPGNLEAPDWLFPFAEATCTITRHSSFAVIWRLKSYQFSRHTSVTPELTCVVPDYPNVSVTIPCNSVPTKEDFSLTMKVYNFCMQLHCTIKTRNVTIV